MLKEVVDVLLIRSKFSTPKCFRQMFAILRGTWVPDKLRVLKQCSVLLRVRIMTRSVWPVVVDGNHITKHVEVENLERINKTSTASLSICWSFCKRYYKMLGSTIKKVKWSLIVQCIVFYWQSMVYLLTQCIVQPFSITPRRSIIVWLTQYSVFIIQTNKITNIL
jgi:hypothetical protein